MRRPFAFAMMFALLLWGCAPEIGDSCENSVDCDIQNKRVCDLTLPGGYCTVSGCEKSSCPDEAVCVAFRPEPDRLSNSWCMASCDDSSDCRTEYRCRRAEQLGEIAVSSYDRETGEVVTVLEPLARSLDGDSKKFCTVDVPAAAIGDRCETALDCDLEKQERVCDLSLPDGYCTVLDCGTDPCPDDAVCVAFDPEADAGVPFERCMASCDDDLDCRNGFFCLLPEEAKEAVPSQDGEEARFCGIARGN